VPLYLSVYENFKGYTLPGAAAIEKYMRDVGVSSKQTDKARQVFLRSARQANFFEHGEDRLVRPAAPSGPGTVQNCSLRRPYRSRLTLHSVAPIEMKNCRRQERRGQKSSASFGWILRPAYSK
jgi:hypothetical protein